MGTETRQHTFIRSMLASIFSCSTSFLACAMPAVLLLAMGALSQVLSSAQPMWRRRTYKHPRHFSSQMSTTGMQRGVLVTDSLFIITCL